MIRVILESPFAADCPKEHAANVAYARQCVVHSLSLGESPLASHLLYTQPGVLDDTDPAQRALGIAAGHAWFSSANRCVVYIDRGISDGMREGMEQAMRYNVPILQRSILNIDHQ